MSQATLDIANQSRTNFRIAVNAALQALASQNSGGTAPSELYPFMPWADTSSNKLKMRDSSNASWIEVGDLDEENLGLLPKAGGAMAGVLQLDAGDDIVAAATTDLGDATGNDITITHTSGTLAITSFGGATDIQKGTRIRCRFNISGGSLSLSYNATSMKIQGLGNLTLVDGMSLDVVKISDSNAYWAIENITSPSDTSLTVGAIDVQQFRLTLTSGLPVTSSDVTGATTIYCTPYRGNKIALYDGTKWVVRSSAEFSLALGTLTSGRPYDVFCYDNAGVPTLEFTSWTNATSRATALTYQDGILVKSGALTRRYLGTFYTASTTTTEDTSTKRYLWNYYNRALRPMIKTDATANWNYTTPTYRQARADVTNQLDFVIGVQEDAIVAQVHALCAVGSTASYAVSAIGLDSTTAVTGLVGASAGGANAGQYNSNTASWRGFSGIGKHYLAWLEYSVAVSTTQWGGNDLSGIQAEILG
jgi:hypothetical protein